MLVTDYALPVPYIKVNEALEVLYYSEKAAQLFHIPYNFLHLADEENERKLRGFLALSRDDRPLEISLQTKESPFELFDLYVTWDHYVHGHIICIRKEDTNAKLEQMVQQLQHRLLTTDFELFEKKEELEKAFYAIDQLSGPFIMLSGGVALIPLFGDITDRKINAIKEQTLKRAYEHELETALFDFTAVGTITLEGLLQLDQLFRALRYMGGIAAVIVGVKPIHAQQLHNLDSAVSFTTLSTLKDALQKYI
ncbi:hypothetical protein A374_00555 [Fictibacillus macauensis ZFHKF-1]|uniref:STAS domain-containing protein n=1 Tax=Fictibacillus macauensis ZFHKF-1 TaxID=1196324 RepID=I8ANL1_9BACL|nr:DUF2703 domain-containing protein [Fictibacillus macauensis]EIT87419.1 hypothetical protein A374_00555 [Fictibacillus macauensis ZFHKF-1]